MTLYLFSQYGKQKITEKNQVEKKNIFFCFHFLNAPVFPKAGDPQMSNVGKRSDGR